MTTLVPGRAGPTAPSRPAALPTARLAAPLALLAAVTLLVGCAASPPASGTAARNPAPGDAAGPQSPAPGTAPAEPPTLTVGTADSAAPWSFRQDDQVTGLEIDLAHELARRLGRSPRIISMFFPDLPYELSMGRIDIIMAGLSVTPERQQDMAFVQPYLRTGQRLAVRRADARLFGHPADLDRGNVRVGVEQGSTGADAAREHLPRARVVAFATLAKALEGLQTGQVDAVIHDAPTLAWAAREDPADQTVLLPGLLSDEPIAWALRLDNPALLAEVETALAAMRADGTLDRLLAKWVHD